MFSQILDGQTICISITHLDGMVLAKTLFNTGVNYRSVVLFGKAVLVEDEEERMLGLKTITENIIPGRWDEVQVGNEQQLKATMVIKIDIVSASAKVRNEGPLGDEDIKDNIWSGLIPLAMKALPPIQDHKFGIESDMSESVKKYFEKHK